MSAPSGYTALDFVGFTDKGTYSPIVNYMRNDLVHYGGNIMRCLIDNTKNVTPVVGANWELWVGASANLVERVIAPLENNPADVAFGVGRQIIYDDWLWEVIAPIEVGDALIDYDVDPTNANIKKSAPVETQLLAVKAEADATDNMIAPTEASASSSSAAYSVGDQLILNNILYDVIAAIQIGDALTTGTSGNIKAADNLTDQLKEVDSSIQTLTDQADAFAKGGDIILITASYGVTPSTSDNCLVYLESLLDGIYDHVYTSAISGASFTDGRYLSQLQTLADEIEKKDYVKDIVVIGYGNDASAAAQDLVDAMIEFNTYARDTFPNAKVSLAPVSVLGTAAGSRARFNLFNTIMTNMHQHKIGVMTDLFNLLALDYDTYTGADKWHPSSAGARLIANGIYNVLVHGEFNKQIMKNDPLSNKTFPKDLTSDTGYFMDEVSTDNRTMTASIVVTFKAVNLTHFSLSWAATKLMTCNPLFRGMVSEEVFGLRSFHGTVQNKTTNEFIPVRVTVAADSDGVYWYYVGTLTGQNYVMQANTSHILRAFGNIPFMFN